MKDLLEILDAMAARRVEVADPRELLLDMADRVVKAASQAFSCKTDEVAILVLTSDGKHLRFVAPRKFTDLGTIPTTKRDSIAVGVFSRRVGEATNNVPLVKHVAFYETVKLREKAAPIQKMVTVPVLRGDRAVGVAQISRKGENPPAAGPDFTAADVRKVQHFFEQVAPYLESARPERF